MLDDEFQADAMDGLDELSGIDALDDHLEDIDNRIDALLNKETKTIFWTTTRKLAATIALILVSALTFQLVNQGSNSAETGELTELKKSEADQPSTASSNDSLVQMSDKTEFLAEDSTVENNALLAEVVEETEPLQGIDQEMELAEAVVVEDSFEKVENNQISTLAKITEVPKRALRGESLEDARPTDPRSLVGIDSVVSGRVRGAPIENTDIKTLVTGTVFSLGNGNPLSNVIITEKGTNNQIITSLDGKFSIPITQAQSILSLQAEGYKAKEISANDTSGFSIVLEPELAQRAELFTNSLLDSNRLKQESKADFGFKVTPDMLLKDGPASPIAGQKTFDQYLADSLRYPAQALANNVRGRVVLEFTVLEDGSVDNFEVIRGLGSGCNEEAIRLIQEGPTWQPKIENRKAVISTVRKTIRFRRN